MTTGLKIIFAGTPEFAATPLRELLVSQHQILAVYTQPDRPAGRGQKIHMSPVKELAQKENIPVYQPKSFDLDECERIRALQADLMLVIAYGLLLPAVVLSSPSFGCINIHASLLPRWRGAAPIQRAIISGDKHTGITIMQMVEELDAGPVMYQAKCEITPTDTTLTLQDRLARLASQKIGTVLQRLAKHELTPIPQDESCVTYANKLSKQEANIDWQESASQIERKIRAFNPWPVAYTYLNGMRLRIWEAAASTSHCQLDPGNVVGLGKQGIEVATGEGVLILKALQLPGAKVISATDFSNAHDIAQQCFSRSSQSARMQAQA